MLSRLLAPEVLSSMPLTKVTCGNCGTSDTPLMRAGPECMPNLCNACWARGKRSSLLVHCVSCKKYHGDMRLREQQQVMSTFCSYRNWDLENLNDWAWWMAGAAGVVPMIGSDGRVRWAGPMGGSDGRVR